MLLGELPLRKVRTLAFVRSRRMAELLYVFVRDMLRASEPGIAARLGPYGGSYLPEDGEGGGIERDLLDGRLLGLTTTSAMDLVVTSATSMPPF